ncbi:hypothetical protein [Rossellomorea arthrocnemi]|jgi:hypothetical protein|uniref:hypothetical protein n=1 Tax=Rossellomorea arthrocnemi TaxID=2769542 RepID=UPI00191A021E|nr:hypothetical protein [Rossellomorea arthrocnemi]
MIERLTKKVFVLLALLIVLFQSFSFPIYASATIKPWEGNPWTGDSWEGSPWDPQQFKWEGNPWEGKSTQGNDWEGNGTEGQGTNGQGTNGQSWEGFDWSNSPWYMDPWVMNGWTPNGFQGNGTEGNPFNGNGTNGNPFGGNTTNGAPFYGYGTNGGPFTGTNTNGSVYTMSPYNPSQPTTNDGPIYSPYDWFKFGVSDIGMNSIKTIAENNIQLNDLGTWNLKSKSFYLNLMENSFKFGAKDIGVLEAGADAIDVGKNFKDFKNNYQYAINATNTIGTKLSPYLSNPQSIIDAVKSAKVSNLLSSASNFGQTTYSSFKAMAPLSKLNVVGAAVGAGFSAVDSYQNTVKLFNADNGGERVKAGADLAQSSGSLLMNVGTGVAAFPGGQVVGGALIAGGAVLWLGGTAVKHWSTIKSAVTHPVETVKKLGKGIANKAKKTWSTVKGWFS